MAETRGTRVVRSLGIERPGQALFFSDAEEPPNVPFEDAPAFPADLAARPRHAIQAVLEVSR